MKPISENILTLLRKILKNQHPLLADIVIRWEQIVGPKFGKGSSPFKISQSRDKGNQINILHVQVDNSSLSLEISYQQDVIIERLAIYFGYKAIHKLRIIVSNL